MVERGVCELAHSFFHITRPTAQCRSCELYEIAALNTDQDMDIPHLVLIVVHDYFDVGVGNVN